MAALTARQYREAKKQELQNLKSEVISLRKDVEYYKNLCHQMEGEITTLKEKQVEVFVNVIAFLGLLV